MNNDDVNAIGANLANEWQSARAAEVAANRERVTIEQRLVELYGAKPEGAKSVLLADGRKITLTGKINREVDEVAWRAVLDRVPEHLRPIRFVETCKLDVKALRELDAPTYAIVASAITAKPAKVAVSIEMKE
jgi:hypothetical protein